MGSNPTSTAADQARCRILAAGLCLPGRLLSQFVATKQLLCQARAIFPVSRVLLASMIDALAATHDVGTLRLRR